MTDTLRVLKVVAEGLVTSFRQHPIALGIQPTFTMPPPATVYGHICSAVGGWLDPPTIRFGYHFVHQGEFEDYEHLYFLGNLNPQRRRLLFQPRLTLYIDQPGDIAAVDFEAAFRSPYYAVALGRSQDLMTYVSVEWVSLELAQEAYLEATLIPLDMAVRLQGNTVAATMPRFIDEQRQPTWEQYAVLRGRAKYPPTLNEDEKSEGLVIEGEYPPMWVDPAERDYPRRPDLARAVIFHSFVGSVG